MLGGGAVAIVIAVAVIAVVALNLTGGDTNGGGVPAAATELPAHAHILGDANAPVTVVEYGDFQ